MKTIRKTLIFSLLALLTISCKADIQTDSLWHKEFACAREIIDTYLTIKKSTSKKDKEQHTLNACHYAWQSGEYMFRCRGKNEDIALLPEYAQELELDNEMVSKFMEKHNAARFVDHYFTLQAMKRGCSFDASRDGIEMTVFFPIRGLNENDYSKLNTVFTCKNEALHTAYLKKMMHMLSNNGCNNELMAIRKLIEENVADSEQKEKVLALYDIYETVMPGKQAPNVIFKDAEGVRYTINGFKGKVIVIDVWATWCSSCLKNMPKFMELIKEFENRDDIVLFTVSTDSDDLKEKWLAAIKRHKMEGMLNLTPDRSTTEQFEERYFVSAVPRYIVIDKQGKIISVFAPKPGDELKEIIVKALND